MNARLKKHMLDYARAVEAMTLAEELDVSPKCHRAAEKNLADAHSLVEADALEMLAEHRAEMRRRALRLIDRGAYDTAAELAELLAEEA